jgi:enoyl-CoA hydratase
MSDTEIICERRGAAGFITLNRPQALNALTHGMVRTIAAALDAWEFNTAVERIVITGASGRAFCAGGDLRALYDQGRAGDRQSMLRFWADEYRLNHRIKTYPKPYVALIDGIVMGGGVGVSLHGSHRVASDNFMFAMPEVSIGFFPDVGATWFLPRLPGRLGLWAALTGGRFKAGDACAFGLADAYVPSANLAPLTKALESAGDTSVIIARFSAPSPPAALAAARGVIDQCFAAGPLAQILARLKAVTGDETAARAVAAMRRNAPLSMAVALRQMEAGASMSFAAAMQMEYRIVSRVCRAGDFYEGVRALIIDKDQAPQWRPATIAALDPAQAAAYFAPLAEGDLILPAPANGQQ